MSQRQDRLSSLLKEEVANFLAGTSLGKGIVIVKEAFVTRDLSQVEIWVSVIGQNSDNTLKKLEKLKNQLRGYFLKRLRIKKVPQIKWQEDTSGQITQNLEEKFREIELRG